MPVIITDMELPKRCLDCQLMGREKMYCQLHPRKDLNVIRVVSEKPDWCPIKEAPTGKWKIGIYSGDATCSNCHTQFDADKGLRFAKYCPNCGAKMKGEVEE